MVKRRRGRNGSSAGLLESINEDGNVVVVNEEFVNVVGGPDAPQVVKELSEQTDPLAAQRDRRRGGENRYPHHLGPNRKLQSLLLKQKIRNGNKKWKERKS